MRGGEGRKTVLTWLQKQKRATKLPETLRKLDDLPDELIAAIRKRAKVPEGVTFRKMTPSQRYAMREAAKEIYISINRKAEQAKKAFFLLVEVCTTDEP